MAEHLFRKMLSEAGQTDVQVASAGVSPATWLEFPQEARAALKNEGVLNVAHQAQGLSENIINWSDLILVMEDHHKHSVMDRFPKAAAKIRLLDPSGIRDPYGASQEIYNTTLAQIKAALQKLIESI